MVSRVAATLVTLVGLSSLAGWILDVDALKAFYGTITIKVNASIALVLAGTSLLVLRRAPRLGGAFAGVVTAIAAATLFEHATGIDLGIDQLLFSEPPGAAATASPNRMGLNASISLLIGGVALMLLARGKERAAEHAQRLGFVMMVLPFVALAGYAYGAEQLYGIARFTGIALHTAVAFAILATGIVFARPDVGAVAVWSSDGPAGTLLRRLTLPIALIPLVLGYLEIQGRNLELFDRGLGVALLTVSLTIVLIVVMWATARGIERSDRQRREIEAHRDELIVSERAARESAEHANWLKDQFIATLSHELRTPLNVMLGWTQTLETDRGTANAARAATIVARNGRLLARLIEDLLDMSRVTTGHFEIVRRPASLNELVKAAADAHAPTAAAKGITVETRLDPAVGTLSIDSERIQQIAGNLLANAIKFTPAGGRVEARTAVAGSNVTLTVSDTGIGFDEAFSRVLFTPFRQADPSAQREHGGLGIGLSIARSLALLHGGTLTGSSPGPGRGATFVLTLPTVLADARSGARPERRR